MFLKPWAWRLELHCDARDQSARLWTAGMSGGNVNWEEAETEEANYVHHIILLEKLSIFWTSYSSGSLRVTSFCCSSAGQRNNSALRSVASVECRFGKLIWRVPLHYKQDRKSILKINLKNEGCCLVTLSHVWGEREWERRPQTAVQLLRIRAKQIEEGNTRLW